MKHEKCYMCMIKKIQGNNYLFEFIKKFTSCLLKLNCNISNIKPIKIVQKWLNIIVINY